MSNQRVVLLLQRMDDGPWSRVRDVDRIEVVGRESDVNFYIEHKELNAKFPVCGLGVHEIAIPAGRVRVKHMACDRPVTVYAWS